MSEERSRSTVLTYHITGGVARDRILPLLSSTAGNAAGTNNVRWEPISLSSCDKKDEAAAAATATPDFLWENSARRETKDVRDWVRCYSHLPNGSALLDSKWVLGRLMGGGAAAAAAAAGSDDHLATLETHCFRGISGFQSFAEKVGLLADNSSSIENEIQQPSTAIDRRPEDCFRDLILEDQDDKGSDHFNSAERPNLWVVKDSHSNGAGGIWVVGPANVARFLVTHNDGNQQHSSGTPLYEDHTYVAQAYAWPPVLFRHRKCHVRVYAALTSDGRAWCHRRCFLHVANDPFVVVAGNESETSSSSYQDSVHITNCCANSHDDSKFAGEICADLDALDHCWRSGGFNENGNKDFCARDDHELIIGLSEFAHSIRASIAKLAELSFPFLRGGQGNRGFEYLGLDFILSYNEQQQPVAYLLEVNAPPSQDTATGLPHAEDLHNEVIRDLLTLWVYPSALGVKELRGGWQCVYTETPEPVENREGDVILPSKAAILNKIRWTLYERKQLAAILSGEKMKRSVTSCGDEKVCPVSTRARSFFPYFAKSNSKAESSGPPQIFFENAGGTQVPSQVITAVSSSLESRHRSVTGAQSVAAAKAALSVLLGASPSHYSIFLNANASTLLAALARRYVQSGLLRAGDEIILCIENHQANLQPWLDAAQSVGAFVKWWDFSSSIDDPKSLSKILSNKTRIVAFPHASNILGEIWDVGRVLNPMIKRLTNGNAHIVVDGVAAAPHRFVAVDELGVDWYVLSCHKLFGPHLAALCGRTTAVDQMKMTKASSFGNYLELGTLNFEACEGVRGIGRYLMDLHCKCRNSDGDDQVENLVEDSVRNAFQLIERAEGPLVRLLLRGLQSSSKIRILGTVADSPTRIPVVSFVHNSIPSSRIVAACSNGGVICRNGTFLSSKRFQEKHAIDGSEGVVRFSLVHYNTVAEVKYAISLLESIPNWF